MERGIRSPYERHSVDEGLTGYIIRSCEPVVINTYAENFKIMEEYHFQILGNLPKSYVGIPLVSAEKVVGVMAIQNYELENAYRTEDLALFQTIGSQVAKSLENVQLFDAVRQRAREAETLREAGASVAAGP